MPFGYTTYPNDNDYIGNESGNDLQTKYDVVNFDHNALAPQKEKKIRRCIRNKEEKRELPPPIPFLAQTQNLASHMPYVLKRFYTNEGRLIIKEEKVKHHEYFHAHRENGRLTLQLVPLDDDDYNFFVRSDEEKEEEEEELVSPPTSPHEEINDVTIDQSVVINASFEEVEEKEEEEEENKDNSQKSVGAEVVVENENEIVGGANSRGNCLNCKSAPSGIFGVLPLHPIRTVRS